MDRIIAQAKQKMAHSIEATSGHLAAIRTGRATPAILEHIKVEAYGDTYPVNQLATIGAPEPRLLTIVPFDKSTTKAIERAILTSDLGLTPNNDGHVIRLQIPQLTEERRKELAKVVRERGEEGRVAIRNIRRDANEHLKKAEKNHEISEDDAHRAMKEIQELTDEYIEKIDEVIKAKEKEILEE